jgi:hypothetical protein
MGGNFGNARPQSVENFWKDKDAFKPRKDVLKKFFLRNTDMGQSMPAVKIWGIINRTIERLFHSLPGFSTVFWQLSTVTMDADYSPYVEAAG